MVQSLIPINFYLNYLYYVVNFKTQSKRNNF